MKRRVAERYKERTGAERKKRAKEKSNGERERKKE